MIDRLLALEPLGVKLGLEGITRLCAELGNPQHSFRTLHVAGTNGKGSVTAMAHAALVASGLRAARYTSPHLSDLAERFVIGHESVGGALLDVVITDVLTCASNLQRRRQLPGPPTFFEATTAVAFEIFRRCQVEVAVVEVGLGGRLDATNIVRPVASAITAIGLDHREHLGNTLVDVAREKAGIIKSATPVVIGDLPPAAKIVVVDTASAVGAPVVDTTTGCHAHVSTVRNGETQLDLTTPDGQYGPLVLGLRGRHQVGNALVAVRLLETARGSGLTIPDTAIATGLTAPRWPGRLEYITLREGHRLLLDAAHNVEGAAALAAYLRATHPEQPPLVLGVMQDKDVDGMLRALLPVTSTIVATAPDMARAMPAEQIAIEVKRLDHHRTVMTSPRAVDAFRLARTLGPLVSVAGSIFLVGAIRDAARPHAILG